MLIEIPVLWLVIINILGWLFIHISFAWAGTQLPATLFQPHGWICRIRAWEGRGHIYDRLFRVRNWKDKLPDGAALFRGGFEKKSLQTRDPAYLDRFIVETCRGEIVHWTVFAAAFLFFLWNPPWAGGVMVAYGIAANLPCIIALRYNRIRLLRIAGRRS